MSEAGATDPATSTVPGVTEHVPATSAAELDTAVAVLSDNARRWIELGVTGRVGLVDQLLRDVRAVADRWYEAVCAAQRVEPGTMQAAEEWLGPLLVLRHLRLLRGALVDIRDHGRPLPPGEPTVRPDGQVVVPVFPADLYDRLLYPGVSAEVWMQPDVTLEGLADSQAVAYRRRTHQGRVALILGAGNLSAIPVQDVLSKLFVDDAVVLLKMSPVNDYLGPVFTDALRALVEGGFLRIVYGGSQQGSQLVNHDGVDEIHLTGSAATHDAIMFGSGEEAARRRQDREPLVDKPVTSELGNVTPVIVVPGPWSDRDVDFHGDNIATMLVNNAGFNCVSARVIVTHGEWARRSDLLNAVRGVLAGTPPRHPYHPGAEERWQRFVDAHPQAERFGPDGPGAVPWTLIPDVDPHAEQEIAFTTEPFCGVCAEVPLDAPRSVPAFIDRAVSFCNERLWGTLAATIIVHPRSLRDPEVARALDRAIADLRYGAVVLNHWAGLTYGMATTPWGGHPGQDISDVQSGRGIVHNVLMFDRPQKSVTRGPFRMMPKPAWFATNRTAGETLRRLVDFEAAPSPEKLPGIVWSALRG